ncbi:GNAT family acetyltransferase [Oceanidesulfovibrio indonesiensis]|uniref:GNAT family acetyltransferase n=1 Tax=Oceanidesulfovibrio indonesiensis TaxID=54767 RepID=A0A7M3MG08_9BACT|nr:GNAT family acetyltransferase [Oceanidesulfovibrio indonesiensis]TVM18256.1 GNAT family acetyltransferase [Oceanidesulfovibrio indonesiensis]
MNNSTHEELYIGPCTLDDMEGIVAVWRECGLTAPQNNPWKDIQRKLRQNDGLFLVARTMDQNDGRVIGTVMGGYDGHRGWIYYLGVLPAYQGADIGRKLVECVTRKLAVQGCPKINLQVRASNLQCLGFYETLGFEREAVLSYGKRLDD